MDLLLDYWWLWPAWIAAGVLAAVAGIVGERLLHRIQAWRTRRSRP